MFDFETVQMVISFLGGLGLFIYGMHVMSEGLQKAVGGKMKDILGKLTRNKYMGVLVGALVTAVIQSSSATTVMVVGFVNAGIMTLNQCVGIIMGANIGTTITSWIVSVSEWFAILEPTTLAPIAIAIGIILNMGSKKVSHKLVGETLIGFGLLFIGISSMSASVEPLAENPMFANIMQEFGSNPILGILAGAFITMLVQSSSASVGILQSIVILGIVPWSSAVYIILGQNIGTCITALLSSIGASKNAKAASYIHLLFNVVGSAIFAVIFVIYFNFINPELASTIITVTDVSIFHTAFNVAATILLMPFSNLLIKGARKMAGIKEEDAKESVVNLDDRILETPAIALQTVYMQLEKLSNLAVDIFDRSSEGVMNSDISSLSKIDETEKEIDYINEKVSEFLTKMIKREDLYVDGSNDITQYFYLINDLERIGDHSVNISEQTEYLHNNEVSFSESAHKELGELIAITEKGLLTAIEAFKTRDVELAKKACDIEEEIDEFVKVSKDRHIKRLTKDECEIKSGIAFLDLIANYERISDHSRNIAETVLQ